MSNGSHVGPLILAGMALWVVAIPAFAQDSAAETAAEKGYTLTTRRNDSDRHENATVVPNRQL